jgi:oligosaccharide repeat unit polymerase
VFRLKLSTSFFLAAGVGLYAVFLYRVGGLNSFLGASYAEKHAMMDGLGPFVSGYILVQLAVIFLFFHALRNRSRKSIWLLWGLILSLYVLFASSVGKRLMLIVIVTTCMVGYNYCVKQLTWKPLVAVGVTVFSIMLVIRVTRNLQSYSTQERLNVAENVIVSVNSAQFNPASFEFGGPFIACLDVIAYIDGTGDYLYGASYGTALLNQIPRMLYEDRPVGTLEWYLVKFYRSVWETGGGLSFSPIAEAYMNFGWAGPLLIFFLVGIVVKFLSHFLTVYPKSPPIVLVYGVSLFFFVYMHRLDTESILKMMLISVLPAFLGILFSADWKQVKASATAQPTGVLLGSRRRPEAFAPGSYTASIPARRFPPRFANQ